MAYLSRLLLEQHQCLIGILQLSVQLLVLIAHELEVGEQCGLLLLIQTFLFSDFSFLHAQSALKLGDIATEFVDSLAPLSLSLASILCLDLKLVFLHFDFREVLAHLV